jgi:predicted aspartyl protease
VIHYPYQIISIDPNVPPAPILRVSLFNSVGSSGSQRLYELDALLDTGADCTLIPLEAVSVLQLPFLGHKFPVQGVGGAMTTGFLCQTGLWFGEIELPLLEILACEAIVVGGRDQMIIGRDILNRCCVKFDGKRQQFSFEEA